MKQLIGLGLIAMVLVSCKKEVTQLPEIAPTLKTEKTPHDSDDAAIWINPADSSKSIVFGTDKDELNGGVYAFDLNGKIIKEKSITGLSYPNNADIEYGFKLADSTTTDILVFVEREKHRFRVYSVPDMKPLDNGGINVFENETDPERKRPMGISVYKNPATGSFSVIVSRKIGPKENYLAQYELVATSKGVSGKLMRYFGTFSGNKEIESIAVDDALGFVYYSDEGVCLRKYHADPIKGNKEIATIGKGLFTSDVEGIAIATYEGDKGYIIVSNQQDHSFHIFKRADNSFVKTVNLGTVETDGCEVTTANLGSKFPNGLFVSMNDNQDFFFHSLELLQLEK